MKLLYSISFLSLVSILLTLFLLRKSTYTPPTGGHEEITELIGQIKQEFVESHEPLRIIQVDKLRKKLSYDLIDTSHYLPRSYKVNPKELRLINEYQETCSNPPQGFENKELKKALAFTKLLCAKPQNETDRDIQLKKMEELIKLKPYTHINGLSYAYRIYLDFPLAAPQEWLMEWWDYFHIAELKELNKSIHNPEQQNQLIDVSFLFDLTHQGLHNFAEVASLVHGNNFLFFLHPEKNINGKIKVFYQVYRVSDFQNFLAVQSLLPNIILDPSIQTTCLAEEANSCFRYQTDRKETVLWLLGSSILFFILSTLTLLLLLYRQHRRAQKDKELAFMTLAHELRSPVTAMSLILETNEKTFAKVNLQKIYNPLIFECNRLINVIKQSARYLQVKGPRTQPDQTIISINSHILDILSQYPQFTKLPPKQDGSLKTDIERLDICLENLMENALNHGVAPHQASWLLHKNTLEITIQDAGQIPLAELQQMGKEFSKGHKSKGLGLGLHIVKTTIEGLKGELIVKAHPTRYIVRLKRHV